MARSHNRVASTRVVTLGCLFFVAKMIQPTRKAIQTCLRLSGVPGGVVFKMGLGGHHSAISHAISRAVEDVTKPSSGKYSGNGMTWLSLARFTWGLTSWLPRRGLKAPNGRKKSPPLTTLAGTVAKPTSASSHPRGRRGYECDKTLRIEE